MPFALRGSRRIHYRVDGVGQQTLLFANSLGQGLEMWAPQVSALEDKFRIIRFDHRGHGESDSDGEVATVEDLALDVLAVLNETQTERVHFVGLSLGGMIGQWLGVNYPQRLMSLTLCATAACLPPSEGWEQRAANALIDGMEPFVTISRGRWFTSQFCITEPEIVDTALNGLRKTNVMGYAACCRAIRDFDLRGAVSSIKVPTLLIAGASDPSTPPQMLEELCNMIEEARIVILQDAAHLVSIEKANEVNGLIVEFIS